MEEKHKKEFEELVQEIRDFQENEKGRGYVIASFSDKVVRTKACGNLDDIVASLFSIGIGMSLDEGITVSEITRNMDEALRKNIFYKYKKEEEEVKVTGD